MISFSVRKKNCNYNDKLTYFVDQLRRSCSVLCPDSEVHAYCLSLVLFYTVMALNEGSFEISPLELKELMSRRREDAVLMISELGGLDEIARQMKTDLQRGISLTSRPKDLDNRRSHFGVNVLPIPYQEKSLARNVCESCLSAVQDKLLVAFIVIAIISMILGLAIEPKKVIIIMHVALCNS